MGAGAFSVAHMFDHVSQTLLECVFGLAPSVRHLQRIGLVDQSTQAASRKPAEAQTIFHLDMPDAVEAERRTQAALRPNVPRS